MPWKEESSADEGTSLVSSQPWLVAVALKLIQVPFSFLSFLSFLRCRYIIPWKEETESFDACIK